MHDALRIAEIFDRVVQSLNDADRDIRTLAILARTCKTFQEQALDTLWYQQESLVPLLRLMPRVLKRGYTERRSRYSPSYICCEDYLEGVNLWEENNIRDIQGDEKFLPGFNLPLYSATKAYRTNPESTSIPRGVVTFFVDGPTLSSEQQRIREYTRRIHKFSTFSTGDSSHIYYDDTALEALFDCHAILFPRLSDLSWPISGIRSHQYSWFFKFLGPKLSEIHMRSLYSDHSLGARYSGQLTKRTWKMLTSQAPGLRTLGIHCSLFPRLTPDIWPQFSALRFVHLFVDLFDIQHWCRIAEIPNLQDLHCTFLKFSESTLKSRIEDFRCTFPYLRSFELTSNLEECVQLFGCSWFSVLENLKVSFNQTLKDYDMPDPWVPLNLLRLIPIHLHDCASTLVNLHIAGRTIFTADYPTTEEELPSLSSATAHALKKIMEYYPNIQYLHLDDAYFFEPDDAFLEELAIYWPNLIKLHLDPNRWPGVFQSSETISVTLSGVFTLTQRCPNLREVRILLHADGSTLPTTLEYIYSPSLRILDVGKFSSIDNWEKVAAFILHRFPNVLKVEKAGIIRGIDEDDDRAQFEWGEVNRVLWETRGD
ncbi:hypothetical protein C8Q75DRAFT_804356 [Abortiporus biennis]|nr:hypothetical protein C8Q75DRAFT_804356 [Abortiporus biennis]